MNKIVGVFDAKAQFSRIVERAEHGEETIITRHGKAVAKVSPVARPFDRAAADEAVQRLMELGEKVRRRHGATTHEEIKAWINEGRP